MSNSFFTALEASAAATVATAPSVVTAPARDASDPEPEDASVSPAGSTAFNSEPSLSGAAQPAPNHSDWPSESKSADVDSDSDSELELDADGHPETGVDPDMEPLNPATVTPRGILQGSITRAAGIALLRGSDTLGAAYRFLVNQFAGGCHSDLCFEIVVFVASFVSDSESAQSLYDYSYSSVSPLCQLRLTSIWGTQNS